MQITTKVRYAARAMAALGCGYPDEIISLRNLAEMLQISEKYLEAILKSARCAKLVRTTRGANGGFALARHPESITLLDVFNAVEGELTLVDCLDAPDDCPLSQTCPTRDTWSEVRDAILAVLEQTNVEKLVDRKIMKTKATTLMYHI